jgi:hypothetical protein
VGNTLGIACVHLNMVLNVRYIKRFAWFPVHTECNKVVWLKYYYVRQKISDVVITGKHTCASRDHPTKWIDWEEFSFLHK